MESVQFGLLNPNVPRVMSRFFCSILWGIQYPPIAFLQKKLVQCVNFNLEIEERKKILLLNMATTNQVRDTSYPVILGQVRQDKPIESTVAGKAILFLQENHPDCGFLF